MTRDDGWGNQYGPYNDGDNPEPEPECIPGHHLISECDEDCPNYRKRLRAGKKA